MAVRRPRRKYRRRARRRLVFSVAQVLAWADAFHLSTGHWPMSASGPIPFSGGENWRRVDSALRLGLRGLPGGSSLAQLLAAERGYRNPSALPRLTAAQILTWADAHHRRTGRWPVESDGPVFEAPDESWHAIDRALRAGVRGLPGRCSLACLLTRRRGVRNIRCLPPLTVEQILAWADAHYARTGRWPGPHSGAIHRSPGESWGGIQAALSRGQRGLPGGTTLAQLLAVERGYRYAKILPRLTFRTIRAWAVAHCRRTGAWPTFRSGPVIDAPGETWYAINSALKDGRRGLPGGWTLARLLHRTRHRQ
jgi:hypothetical protein